MGISDRRVQKQRGAVESKAATAIQAKVRARQELRRYMIFIRAVIKIQTKYRMHHKRKDFSAEMKNRKRPLFKTAAIRGAKTAVEPKSKNSAHGANKNKTQTFPKGRSHTTRVVNVGSFTASKSIKDIKNAARVASAQQKLPRRAPAPPAEMRSAVRLGGSSIGDAYRALYSNSDTEPGTDANAFSGRSNAPPRRNFIPCNARSGNGDHGNCTVSAERLVGTVPAERLVCWRAFRVGDRVVWAGADADIPSGTIGKISVLYQDGTCDVGAAFCGHPFTFFAERLKRIPQKSDPTNNPKN
jgi:hypothetical protein